MGAVWYGSNTFYSSVYQLFIKKRNAEKHTHLHK